MAILRGLLPSFAENEPFVALVSPAIRRLYGPRSLKLNAFLRSLGALSVHPVDAGIPEFARLSAQAIAERGRGIHILSACPAAKPFLRREHPELALGVLEIPSPMALIARSALGRGFPAGVGRVLALSPCVHKRSEAQSGGFSVLWLGDLLKAAKAQGIDPFALEGLPYDGEVPPDGFCDDIPALVCAELGKMGVSARGITLDGVAAARTFLESGYSAAEASLVIQLEFCEGGCSVAID